MVWELLQLPPDRYRMIHKYNSFIRHRTHNQSKPRSGFHFIDRRCFLQLWICLSVYRVDAQQCSRTIKQKQHKKKNKTEKRRMRQKTILEICTCLCTYQKSNWIIIKCAHRNRWAWPVIGSVRVHAIILHIVCDLFCSFHLDLFMVLSSSNCSSSNSYGAANIL